MTKLISTKFPNAIPTAACAALAVATACTPEPDAAVWGPTPVETERAPQAPRVETLWEIPSATYYLDDYTRLHRLPDGEIAWLSYNRYDNMLQRFVADPRAATVTRVAHDDTARFLREDLREQRYGTATVTRIGGQPTRIDLATGEVAWRLDRRHDLFPQPAPRILAAATPCPGTSSLRLIDVETGAFETLLEEPDEHSSLQVQEARLLTLADGTEAVYLAQGLGSYDREGTRLSVYDLPDMRLRWSRELRDSTNDYDRGVRTYTPHLAGDLLVVPSEYALLAFDAASGAEVYRTTFGEDEQGARGLGATAFDASTGTLFAHTWHSKLFGVDVATGQIAWESAETYWNTLSLGVPAPGVVLALDNQNATHLFDGATGTQLREIASRREHGHIFPSPLYDVDADAFYYYDGHAVYAVDARLRDHRTASAAGNGG